MICELEDVDVIQDRCPEKTRNPVSSLALQLVSEHSYWGNGKIYWLLLLSLKMLSVLYYAHQFVY
jgi:hypothetical protein